MATAKVMVKGDVEGNPSGTPVDLTKRVTMYAPKGAAHHAEGEETQVSESLVDHFTSLGYTTTKKGK
ncbi:MAG: hypothetical protein H0X46_06595 [Bacteroidetes bacterium]|nr:hypothetical protein [Bacteroidota bacterium]